MSAESKIMTGVAALVLAAGLTGEPALGMGERPPVEGMPAAEFTLTDLNGRAQNLKDYRGKIVLLNFWATWCKPCTTEMPAMQASYDRLRDKGLVVLAINELEDTPKVIEHIRTYGHTFPVLMDSDNRVANLYGVVGLPVSVFIDETGTIREYIKGGLLNEQKINDELLAVQGSPADIGGYYRPDDAKADAVMRPSATLNEALASL